MIALCSDPKSKLNFLAITASPAAELYCYTGPAAAVTCTVHSLLNKRNNAEQQQPIHQGQTHCAQAKQASTVAFYSHNSSALQSPGPPGAVPRNRNRSDRARPGDTAPLVQCPPAVQCIVRGSARTRLPGHTHLPFGPVQCSSSSSRLNARGSARTAAKQQQ